MCPIGTNIDTRLNYFCRVVVFVDFILIPQLKDGNSLSLRLASHNNASSTEPLVSYHFQSFSFVEGEKRMDGLRHNAIVALPDADIFHL